MAKKTADPKEPTAADRIRSIVERVERLEEERTALNGDIKDIYAEAKSAGLAVKVLRAVIRVRKMDPSEFEEQDTLLALYLQSLGMNRAAQPKAADPAAGL